jgi:Molybdopterin-binding domain of aldehyde dehydrogenase
MGPKAIVSFGAVFAEARVDPEFGTVRLSRMVVAYDAGRIINPKTARSQAIGGIIWGVGHALLEQSETDRRRAASSTATIPAIWCQLTPTSPNSRSSSSANTRSADHDRKAVVKRAAPASPRRTPMSKPERFEIPILGSVLYGVRSFSWAQTRTIVSSNPEPSGECRFIAPGNIR